jgi:hypothetical protein
MDRDKVQLNPRKFGLIFSAGMTTLGSILLWRGRSAGPYVLGVAASVAFLALVAPRVLVPLEKVLARIVRWVSATLTYVVLGLMYYLVITPLAAVIRLLGQDLLEMKIDPKTESYWKEVEPSGSGSRPDQPF